MFRPPFWPPWPFPAPQVLKCTTLTTLSTLFDTHRPFPAPSGPETRVWLLVHAFLIFLFYFIIFLLPETRVRAIVHAFLISLFYFIISLLPETCVRAIVHTFPLLYSYYIWKIHRARNPPYGRGFVKGGIILARTRAGHARTRWYDLNVYRHDYTHLVYISYINHTIIIIWHSEGQWWRLHHLIKQNMQWMYPTTAGDKYDELFYLSYCLQ